jgi:hypothetical protein
MHVRTCTHAYARRYEAPPEDKDRDDDDDDTSGGGGGAAAVQRKLSAFSQAIHYERPPKDNVNVDDDVVAVGGRSDGSGTVDGEAHASSPSSLVDHGNPPAVRSGGEASGSGRVQDDDNDDDAGHRQPLSPFSLTNHYDFPPNDDDNDGGGAGVGGGGADRDTAVQRKLSAFSQANHYEPPPTDDAAENSDRQDDAGERTENTGGVGATKDSRTDDEVAALSGQQQVRSVAPATALVGSDRGRNHSLGALQSGDGWAHTHYAAAAAVVAVVGVLAYRRLKQQ